MGSPFPGPTPPYNNPPIHPEYFKPRLFFISAIAEGETTVITTTLNMDYVIGQLVRLLIPRNCGSREFNGVEGYVIEIPSPNQVTLNINSIGFNPFILAANSTTKPQIIAVGDVNTGAINPYGRIHNKAYIPGSFRNISPF